MNRKVFRMVFMHGPRKFCQRRSNFNNIIFLVDEGREDKRAAIGKWRFDGGPMMAQNRILAW